MSAEEFDGVETGMRRRTEDAYDSVLEELERGKGGTKSTAAVAAASPAAAVSEERTARRPVPAGRELPAIDEEGNLVSPPAYSSESCPDGHVNETELTKALTNAASPEPPSSEQQQQQQLQPEKKKKKGGRSVLFGAAMGLAVAGWVYSGNYVFTLLFTLMTALGQLEYYRMVMQTGMNPARRISVLGACAFFRLWLAERLSVPEDGGRNEGT
mmetsp:Transcript_29106/g.61791  ORF Transcript_29106/g.61791 Transcript_29106/m.61791 type:complete len:213 (+) Transcript_29106:541-1179(+)